MSYYVTAADSLAAPGADDHRAFLLGPYSTRAEAETEIARGRELFEEIVDTSRWNVYGVAYAPDQADLPVTFPEAPRQELLLWNECACGRITRSPKARFCADCAHERRK
jgi:hypothetical protein